MTEEGRMIRDCIRKSQLTERERASAYRLLDALSDREVADEVFPKVAPAFTDRKAVTTALRAVLLGRAA